MQQITYFDLFRSEKYRKLLYSNLINRLGDSIDTLAFAWIVYAFTGNGFWTAIIFAINKIPSFIILPFAGAHVEKLDKKRTIVICDIIRCIFVILLLIVIITNQLSIAILAIFAFCISVAEAFRIPASTAFLTQILDKETLDRGITLNVAVSTITEMLGMALGGILITYLGVYSAIAFDALSFIISIFFILMIRHKEMIEDSIKVVNNWNLLKMGFIYIKSCSILVTTFLIAVLANAAMSPIDSLQTVVVVNIFHGDAGYLSALNICLSIGMIIGGIVYPSLRRCIKDSVLFKISFLFIAFLYFIISFIDLTQNLNSIITIMFCGLYVFYGIFASFLAVGLGLLLMENTEQNYMARVNTLYSSLATAATPVTAAFIGLLTKYLSISVIYIIMSCVIFIFLIFLSLKNRLKQ